MRRAKKMFYAHRYTEPIYKKIGSVTDELVGNGVAFYSGYDVYQITGYSRAVRFVRAWWRR